MQRPMKALLAVFVAGAVLPGVASAKNIQVGATKTPVSAPVCPKSQPLSNCKIVLTKITAMQTKSDGVTSPTAISANGMIDSFTVGVSGISSNAATRKSAIKDTNADDGGPPSVQLTVLRPVGAASAHDWRVAARTPIYPIISYLGKVVEFPLIAPISVVRGEILALSVPTWAPILNYGLSTKLFVSRQNRSTGCSGSVGSTANVMNSFGELGNFGCYFTGTRVEYSALEVTSP